MKKTYVQPEFETLKLSSLNDFLNTGASPDELENTTPGDWTENPNFPGDEI